MLKAASVFSKNAALSSFAPVQFGEIEEPEIPNPRWLKIKNHGCGLCGSDIHFIFMDLDPKCFPAAIPGVYKKHLGHEVVGEVLEVGDEVEGFDVNDRVALRIDWPSCFQMEITPPCPQCAAGNYMICENPGKKAPEMVDTGGGFSPFMVVHETQLFKIPVDLTADRAYLLEPTACAVHTVLRRKPNKDDRILVIGAGTIGLLTAAAVKYYASDAHLSVLVRYDFQAETARLLGADKTFKSGDDLYQELATLTNGAYCKGYFNNEIILGGFDIIYDTIGSDQSVTDSLRWTKGGGSVVLSGINFKPGKIDYTPIWNQEIEFTGINSHALEHTGESTFDLAAEMLKSITCPVEKIITHRFPMNQYKDAIRLFQNKNRHQAVKILLEH